MEPCSPAGKGDETCWTLRNLIGDSSRLCFRRQRFYPEVAPLRIEVVDQGRGGGLGRDPAGDHDELPLCKRGCDAKVLLNEEQADALRSQRADGFDQVLDDI